ncbi:MAG: M20/M25/M40 family metallo-hydrolase [Candidatus Bathyarchaeia archaeon]
MKQLVDLIDSNKDRYVKELMMLCEKPSVSAQNFGIEECAETLVEMMSSVGIETHLKHIEGANPLIIGQVKPRGAKHTIGFYNHYDVQPADPLEQWVSPPFKPEIRNGKIYSRGVSDNKGNIVARLKAVEAVLKVMGEVPIGLRFLIEGEEEIGSINLPQYVEENRDILRAEGYFWEGDGVDEEDRPVVTLGSKGILTAELTAVGPCQDVHSAWAPLLPNPAWRLVWALTSIKSVDEKIKISGWYDDIEKPSDVEMELLRAMPFNEESEKRRFGIKEYLNGVSGVESRKKLYYGTTCNICGFDSGYKGPGMKTVLPSIARVKIDFRLVEKQNPDKLYDMLLKHIESHGFCDVKVRKVGGYEAAKTSPNDPFARFAVRKLEEVYGTRPIVAPTTAGTSPIYLIKNRMGIPVVSCGGVGYPDSNIHSPNENIRIKDFINSIKFYAQFIASYADDWNDM